MLTSNDDRSPSPMKSPCEDESTEFTTPRLAKSLKRLKKLQDAPSLTNSLDFSGTNDCTPQRLKKAKGRNCTPDFCDVEEEQKSAFSLQSSFTTLLNQSDSMKKSCFQLLSPAAENATYNSLPKVDVPSAFKSPENLQYMEQGRYKEEYYQIAVLIIKAYFFTFNQRSENLARLFVEECPFEVIKEEMHSFQHTIQCLSQSVKSFELDESRLEFLYTSEHGPFIITGSGKATAMDGSVLTFTQSFKIAFKGASITMEKLPDMESIIENYTIVHTKLMLSPNRVN
eukprot:TRINITY_DN10227_c0_g1_i7.p3 TRINITY_DN10227_c0_g1~~TRINITY_DN10227_c0_g1_i7.p3  ORF type:complete len:284 (+),score=64.18 TRINITY_DN10227_c0_g1_i7:1480-2331(+)